MDQVGADLRGILLAARIEFAVAVARAGGAFLGLGVAKQQQAHLKVLGIDFPGAPV